MEEMKNKYIMPKAEEIEFEMSFMLCVSGELGGDADNPALSPEMDDFVDDMEDW